MSWKQPVAFFLAVAACLAVTSQARTAPIPLTPASSPVPDGLSVVYDRMTGRVTATAPTGTSLTALELRSGTSSFLTAGCEGLTEMFEVCDPDKVFALDTNGFTSVDYGAILPTGWTVDEMAADLVMDGATVGGGFNTGSGAFVVVTPPVPEPTSACLLATSVGMLCMAFRRRS